MVKIVELQKSSQQNLVSDHHGPPVLPYVLSGVVDVSVEPDDGDVVVEVARVELLVQEDVGGVVLHVGVELGIVVDVPLAESDPGTGGFR